MANTVQLNETDRARIGEAVTAAERGTNGEIVTIVAPLSDAYHDAALHYAVVAMLLVAAVASLAPGLLAWPLVRMGDGWSGDVDPRHGLLVLLVAQIVAFLVVRYALAWMPLRLALTPRATRARRVRRRAVTCFKVGAERRTAARVGILIYLSAGERMAEIIADAAIHQAVPAERWGAAMAALVDEVRHGRVAEGMAAAIGKVGTILAEHFPKTDDDLNELPDRLIEL